MTHDQAYRASFEAIEREALAGTMSIPAALARVALLSLEYARQSAPQARLSSEALERRLECKQCHQPDGFHKMSCSDPSRPADSKMTLK